jgi:hypothetical protein
MMQNKAVLVRNTDQIFLYDGPIDTDFKSDIGDLREMTLGFVQVIYKDNNLYDGYFQLFVSNIYCNDGDDSMFAKYGEPLDMDSSCGSIGWNLTRVGYRFIQIRFTKNNVSSGTARIIARGKK